MRAARVSVPEYGLLRLTACTRFSTYPSASPLLQALHAVTVAYALVAAAFGVYCHCLLGVTGNSLVVPILAHAVYDAVVLVRYHIKV